MLLVAVLVAALLPEVRPSTIPAAPAPEPLDLELTAEHGAGVLDPTFDEDGIAITEISSFVNVLDADTQGGTDRVLVLEGFDDEVWGFHPDGTLDTTFGDGGVVALNVPFAPTRLAASPADGSFVVGGFTSSGVNEGVRVARFLADGQVDSGFGTNGVATVLDGSENGTGLCSAVQLDRTFTGFSDIGVQSNGAVVVTGGADLEWNFNPDECDPSPTPVEGVAAARIIDGAPPDIAGDAPCQGFTDSAEPRSMVLTATQVFISVAFQCVEGPDPITVMRFSQDLASHDVFFSTPEHPTENRPLPVTVQSDGTVAVAARAATGGSAAWNLIRWVDSTSFPEITSVVFPTEVSTAHVLDMALASDGGHVLIGHAVLGAERPSLAIARFGPDGVGPSDGPDIIDHPGPPDTATSGIVILPDSGGSFRMVGHAEPEVFGLDNHRQLLLGRIDGDGTLDSTFGPTGNGFAQHHGRYGDTGEAVAVLSDGRVVAAGRIPETGTGADPPTGFVLRHRDDGALDPEFAPPDRSGIEVTRYPRTPEPLVVVPAATGVAATTLAPGSTDDGPSTLVVAQAGGSTEVASEQDFRDAFGDPDETHITLTADIPLTQCPAEGDPDVGLGVTRDSTVDLTVDGGGHTITQTCVGERLMTADNTGALTFTSITLTGGDSAGSGTTGSGGAVRAGGSVSVIDAVLSENSADESGGAISAAGGVSISGSMVVGNTADFVGGAVHTTGPVTVTDSTFEANTGPHTGGAIFAIGSVTVDNSTFIENAAFSNGGAIYAEPPPGDGISGTITDSLFEANVGDTGDGGAVVLHGDLTVRSSTFTSNSADNGGAIFSWSITAVDAIFSDNHAILGGALYVSSDTGVITRSTFTGNRATREPGVVFDGGAIYGGWIIEINESHFTSNVATELGGAVQAVDILARDSTFEDNRSGGDGGALHALDDVTIERSSFFMNRAGDGADGGAVWATTVDATNATFQANATSGRGGAIAAEQVEVSRSTVTANGAFVAGGGIWADGPVTITDSTLDTNGSGEGGAAWSAGEVRATNSTFFSNGAGLTTVDGFEGHDGGAIRAGTGLSLTYVTAWQNDGASQLFTPAGDLESVGLVVAGPVQGGGNCDVPSSNGAHSYDTDGTCEFTGTTNTSGGPDPFVGSSLANNGGPTQTVLPPVTSPLVNVIPVDVCDAEGVLIDQRGEPRPQGLGCDIGAVEQFGPALDIQVEGLDIDESGRLVIAGSTEIDFDVDGAIHRLLPNGGPDPAFNDGLPVTGRDLFEEAPFLDLVFHDVTVDGAGRIVAVGELHDFYGAQGIVVRLLADGTPDPAFGSGPDPGVVYVTPFVDSESFDEVPLASAQAVVVDDGGRIVVAGWSILPDSSTTRRDLLVARLLDSGTFDASFGNGVLGPGVSLLRLQDFAPGTEVPSLEMFGRGVDTQGDRIVVAGSAEFLGADVPAHASFVAQLTATGSPDTAFGVDDGFAGLVGAFPGQSLSEAHGVVIDPVGNILVSGGTTGETETLVVSRLLATGAPDVGFGDGGIAFTGLDGSSLANDVALAPDGKIVVTGRVTDGRGTRAVVARFNPGPSTLSCVPEPLDLGGVTLGTTNAATLVCTAAGSPQLVTSVSVVPTAASPGEFTITSNSCAGLTLLDGQACQLTVRFGPQLVGARTALLSFDRTTVLGFGGFSIATQGVGTGDPGFSATPNPVIFPAQSVGITSPSRTVTVTNLGQLPLKISGTSIVGAHADDFAIVSNSCLATSVSPSVSPGDSCTVVLTFTPGPGSATPRAAQLRFVDSAPGSPHLVALRGPLVRPTLELDPVEGPIETEVEATGTGFEPGTTVELSIADIPVGTIDGGDVTAGGFTTTFVVPQGTPGGPQDVLACQGCATPAEVAATAIFTVTPRLFVEPAISRPGGVVSARGDGFPANTPVTLDWEPGIGTTVALADDVGEFTIPTLVFRRDILGGRELEARISGSDEVAASVPFLAVPGSSQPGDFANRR